MTRLPESSGNGGIVDYVYNPECGDCITLALAGKRMVSQLLAARA
jgi:hypothetical protein